MREKLNNDPKAQLAIVVVLIVAAAFFFLKGSGGGGSEEEAGAEAGATVASVNGVTATGSTPGEAVENAVESLAEGATASATGSGAMPATVPGPAPPARFTAAYDAGKTVVLLVAHAGGVDDAFTTAAVLQLRHDPDVALFVVPVKQVPRYATVTVGLELNRAPALVVVRPRRLSGGIPQASVDYGFQTPRSVAQAVRDAAYHGPEGTYYPN